MSDYQNYGSVSKNENGREEVHMHYHRTFWQWLTRKPATKEAWQRYGHKFWINKSTCGYADTDKLNEIENLRAELIRNDQEWKELEMAISGSLERVNPNTCSYEHLTISAVPRREHK